MDLFFIFMDKSEKIILMREKDAGDKCDLPLKKYCIGPSIVKIVSKFLKVFVVITK